MELIITDNGRALVTSLEFAAALKGFIRDWAAAGKPTDLGAENVCRIIALSLCEIDPEYGPAVDSPELEHFVIEHQPEIESAGRDFLTLLKEMRVVH
jgi:hypothetical protein